MKSVTPITALPPARHLRIFLMTGCVRTAASGRICSKKCKKAPKRRFFYTILYYVRVPKLLDFFL